MTDAYIYDHVRTPRGRGKKDGSLHEVPAVRLGAHVLEALRDRNGLDTGLVDDIIYGCVDPVGEAGAVIPRSSAFEAGYDFKAPGMQISRFCASGLDAVNFAAAKIVQGADDIVIAGGVESMSRVGMGMSGGAWYMDPSVGLPGYFMPQGVSADLIATKYGFSRDDVDAYAVESQKRAGEAWSKGYFKNSVLEIKDQNGLTILDHDEHMRPTTDMQALASLNPSFVMPGEMGGFNAVGIQAHPEGRDDQSRSSCRQFVRYRRWCRRRIAWLEERRQGDRLKATCPHPRIRQYRFGPGADADRPGRRNRKALEARQDEDFGHRSLRAQ